MGYSPKHAKPVSLRGTALKTPLSGGPGSGPGRHRAGARIPAPRFPGDESVPAGPDTAADDAVPDPVTTSAAAEEAAGEAEHGPAAGHAEKTIAEGTRSQALLRLVPLQRAPLPES